MKKLFAVLLFAGTISFVNADRIDDIESSEQSKAHKLENRQDAVIIEKEGVSQDKAHKLEQSMDAEIRKIELENEKKSQIGQAQDIDVKAEPVNTVQFDDNAPLIPDQMQNVIEEDIDASESSDSPRQ